MATKTISVDLDAYERLKQARMSPAESFSRVIKRARWNAPSSTEAALLEALKNAEPLSDEIIARLEKAQLDDRKHIKPIVSS